MLLPRPLPQGTSKQHLARRSFRGAGQALLHLFKSRGAQVGNFSGSRTLTQLRVIKLSSWPCGRHGGWYPLSQMSSGRLRVPVVKGRQVHAFAGWEIPRRKTGSIRGAMVRKARSTNRAWDRLAAGLQPGQPSRCLIRYHSWGAETITPRARRRDRRRGPGSGNRVHCARFPVVIRPQAKGSCGAKSSARRMASVPLLAAPPAALLVQPPADFPETQARRGQESGPADRFCSSWSGTSFLLSCGPAASRRASGQHGPSV